MNAASVSKAFPEATGRIAVFVHGWCMTEGSWWRSPRDGESRRPYGARLRSDLGFTPVYLRYNTGLHISDNGKALAAVVDQLQALWPVPVEEIALVGHSMGGLVVRSACHYGTQQQHGWPDAVRHVVCLGSPHLGADLEKGVNAASWALAQLPETQALASFLNARSSGTKDLRYGALLDEDWSECDPDEFLRDRCHEVPFPSRRRLPLRSDQRGPAGGRGCSRRPPGTSPQRVRCGRVSTGSVRARPWADADRPASLRPAQSRRDLLEIARLARSVGAADLATG
jgi:pimeloyl-ACP methyl ester carboxylesterase